jgi:hypothetical protein
METFGSPPDKYALQYDAAGNKRADAIDPESQEISNEFKRPPY